MSTPEKGYNINQTFIIDTTEGDSILSACTAFYTTNIYSCSGNTEILLGSTSINMVGDIFVSGNLSANTVSATTYYGDGSNLTGISTQDTFVTGGTYITSASTLTFTNNTGGTFNVTGITTSSEFTGGTVTGATSFTDGLTANTISATTYQNLPLDVFVTGGTYSDGITTFTNNTGGTFNVNGFYTGGTDVFVTGATYDNANKFTFTNVTGGTFDVSFDVLTGLTVNGGLSATTLYGDGSNITGINLSQLATTAHTHPISDVINLQNTLDNKIDEPVISYLGDYLYYNGVTWVPNQINIPVAAGDGVTLFLSVTGSSLPTYEYLSRFPIELTETQDSVVVNNNTALIGKYATEQLNRTIIDSGIWEFNTFASVDVPSTGLTQIIITAYLLSTGGSETFLFSAATENITSTAATLYTFSIVEPQYSCTTTDYLVIDYSATTTNNFNTTVSLYHGGSINYSHVHTPFVTLHNDLAGLQGGFSNQHYHLSKNEIDLLTTGLDASSIHNHNSLYFSLNGGNVSGNTTIIGSLSASTYLGLPIDPDTFVTGFTSSGTNLTILQNQGKTPITTTIPTVSLSGALSSVTFNIVTTGNIQSNGLTATTISATTYQNLPTDIRVTGATYNNNTFTYTNNTGGTFNVLFNTMSGLTINGGLIVTGNTSLQGLSANTISATTYQNLPIIPTRFVTGFTYSPNTFVISDNSGSTFSATINTMSGLTINGGLTVSGNSQLNGGISSTSFTGSTDRIVQVSSGGTFTAVTDIISAYISPLSINAGLLSNTTNWDINGNYIGVSITGTYQGQKHYDSNYFFEAVDDNLWIRLIRG